MFNYTTRNGFKAMALFVELTEAEFATAVVFHDHHYHVQTEATEEQFKIARAAINIPSSNTDEAPMPNPDTVVVPDVIPTGWDKV